MINKADIFVDKITNEVVVTDKYGKEVFRKIKTRQTISIANDIYIGVKY